MQRFRIWSRVSSFYAFLLEFYLVQEALLSRFNVCIFVCMSFSVSFSGSTGFVCVCRCFVMHYGMTILVLQSS